MAYRITNSLVGATIGSYLMCVILALTGNPPVANMNPMTQALAYLVIILMILTWGVTKSHFISVTLLIFYGGAAMLAYSGRVQWTFMGEPNPVHGIVMAIWDMALAVSFMWESWEG